MALAWVDRSDRSPNYGRVPGDDFQGRPFAPSPSECTSLADVLTLPAYAALDLGTNNCRLLIARPTLGPDGENFRIVDAFSRIVRLGEGVSHSGRLSEEAMVRTFSALQICRDKILTHGVRQSKLVATEACRAASNGAEFVEWVRRSLGLLLEVVDCRTEAQLAVAGCAGLADTEAEAVLLFDIGGGSTEVVWLTPDSRKDKGAKDKGAHMCRQVKLWTSLPSGVVTLCEQFGGVNVTNSVYADMVEHVSRQLRPFARKAGSERRCSRFHLLGTSGTVTTLAGIHMGLPRYDRRRVDGKWMSDDEVCQAARALLSMSYAERISHGCIGPERADLVLAGCAILEAIRRAFPASRLRIADRGLREGLLLKMMGDDQVWGHS